MDLLVYMAGHQAEVVTKDQILEDVWPQQFVSESVLSRSIADLRQLLDDDARHPRIIETISKRGYRLVADVAEPRPAAATTTPEASEGPSVVVLPFLDLAPTHDHEYFCDGLAEELTNRLARQPGLFVVARTSAFALKGKATDVREIGRQLGVRTVLEGSVQRSGDRVRITVQLVDASNGCHIWSGRFDRASGDIFAIEDDITRAVVSELRVKLLGGAEALVMHRQTTNPAAHDLYLRGRHRASRRSVQDLEAAIHSYEQALELDPVYAAAHAGIADCYCSIGVSGARRPRDVYPRARAEAERALAIDPDLAEAHAILAHVMASYDWRWGDAERHFQQALELSPGFAFARVWYSHLLTACGRFEEAIAQTERACECDPLAPAVLTTLGMVLYYARQFDRARECQLRLLEMYPSFAYARFFLGRLYRAQGDFEAAVEQFRLLGDAFPGAPGYLAGAERAAGREDEARRADEALERMSRERYVSPLAFASAAHLQDYGTRIGWLSQAFEEREGSVPLLATDPLVDDLRHEPAFQSLIDGLGLPRRAPSPE